MITLKDAKNLSHGDVIYHVVNRNSDNTPQRWRVSGKVKIWKTRPSEVKIPIKYGLYANDYLTHDILHLFCLEEEDAYCAGDFGKLFSKAQATICELMDYSPVEYHDEIERISKRMDELGYKILIDSNDPNVCE